MATKKKNLPKLVNSKHIVWFKFKDKDVAPNFIRFVKCRIEEPVFINLHRSHLIRKIGNKIENKNTD